MTTHAIRGGIRAALGSVFLTSLLAACGDGGQSATDVAAANPETAAVTADAATAAGTATAAAGDSTEAAATTAATATTAAADATTADVSADRARRAPSSSSSSASSTTTAAGTTAGTTATTTSTAASTTTTAAGSTSSSAATTGTASTDALVPTVAGGYSWSDANVARLYGPGKWIMDGLWNINAQRINGRDTQAAIRFRTPVGGNVKSVQLYWSDGAGYAAGNGGNIQLVLLPDDGSASHLPNWNATPLATGSRSPGARSMSGGVYQTRAERFTPDTLNASAPLVANQLYHLVAYNTASDPANNWSSVDMQWSNIANGRPSRWISPTDWASLYGFRSAGSSATPAFEDWTVNGHGGAYVIPIMQMNMADGSSFGNSNMETGNVVANGEIWQNGSSNPVREHFTPKSTKTVTAFSMMTALASGSGGLNWQILQGSTVLASGTIAQGAANAHIDTGVGGTNAVMTWYDVVLPSAVTMNSGSTYDVQFTPAGSSTWQFADQRNGSYYGFTSPAAFDESQAQVYTNGSWMGSNHWDHNSSGSGSNWRVVLHTR